MGAPSNFLEGLPEILFILDNVRNVLTCCVEDLSERRPYFIIHSGLEDSFGMTIALYGWE